MTALTKPTPAFLHGMIRAFYDIEGNGVGGVLHIVLDDDNLETRHVEWCRHQALAAGDTDAVLLAEILLLFGEQERFDILAPGENPFDDEDGQ